MSGFAERYEMICHYSRCNILREIEAGNTAILNQNIAGSLATLLVSSLSLQAFEERSEEKACFVAGYSIGQWTALYAAGAIDFEQLCRIVSIRGEYMNKCLAGLETGMAAVIGPDCNSIEHVVTTLRHEGHLVYLSNYNCNGQHSIAGTIEALRLAEERIQTLKPRKFMMLPVSGAWHCQLLSNAASMFNDFLQSVVINPPSIDVVDNVTGLMLPADQGALRQRLSQHIDHPVRWQEGIRTLIAQGCTRFSEIGFNNILSKFMFFINRDVKIVTLQ